MKETALPRGTTQSIIREGINGIGYEQRLNLFVHTTPDDFK